MKYSISTPFFFHSKLDLFNFNIMIIILTNIKLKFYSKSHTSNLLNSRPIKHSPCVVFSTFLPMASIKIHELCNVHPPPTPSSPDHVTLPLTFFDLFWLRFHPVERIFFYTLHSPPSFFFDRLVPNLKTSLSFTLQHFLPLAGNIVWPSDSDKPVVQYNHGDGVSLVIAESDADFDAISSTNSFRETSESRSFVPHLESSNSHASVLSLQITLFPNKGFSIGISSHHAVLDGKSSIMFLKAWASLCHSICDDEDSPTLAPELEPFLNRDVIKDPKEYGLSFIDNWMEVFSMMFPHENGDGRCLKILPFEPKLEDSVRATFELTREDLEKVKKKVLSKWDMVDNDNAEESKPSMVKPPSTLSTFVLTLGYVSVCIAKALHGVENEKQKFASVIAVDCRTRLEPPVPDAYFGNCVWGTFMDTQPRGYIKEDGVVLITKSLHNKLKSLNDNGVLDAADSAFERFQAMAKEKIEMVGVAGSNRFGVYGIDFGFGKPKKVEIASVDRGLTIGLAENKDTEKGGVEVGLVLNKNVMDLFMNLFYSGLSHQD